MLHVDYNYHVALKKLKSQFLHEKVKILSLCTHPCYECHYLMSQKKVNH